MNGPPPEASSPPGAWMNTDAVIACARLVERAGAKQFQLGYRNDDVPVEEAGWYAEAMYRGARIMVQDRRSPSEAALALAERLLRGAACKCGNQVSLDDRPGCRWRLVGDKWEPGCTAPPISIQGQAGDYSAIAAAMRERQAMNLAEQRMNKPKPKPKPKPKRRGGRR